MKVRFTETALVELADLLAYVADKDRAAATRISDRIDDLVAKLADFPFLAQITDKVGIHKLPVGRYPYVIFYTVEAEEVVVLHVRHGARRIPWEASIK